MKKAIIRFKERTKSRRGYEVYYKEIPRILIRYYFHKLNKRGCWDIEVIDIEDIAKKVYEPLKLFDNFNTNYDDIDHWISYPVISINDNHIPHID